MKDIPVTGKWQMRSDNDLEMLFLNPRRAGKAINARLKDVVFLLDQNKKALLLPLRYRSARMVVPLGATLARAFSMLRI